MKAPKETIQIFETNCLELNDKYSVSIETIFFEPGFIQSIKLQWRCMAHPNFENLVLYILIKLSPQNLLMPGRLNLTDTKINISIRKQNFAIIKTVARSIL